MISCLVTVIFMLGVVFSIALADNECCTTFDDTLYLLQVHSSIGTQVNERMALTQTDRQASYLISEGLKEALGENRNSDSAGLFSFIEQQWNRIYESPLVKKFGLFTPIPEGNTTFPPGLKKALYFDKGQPLAVYYSSNAKYLLPALVPPAGVRTIVGDKTWVDFKIVTLNGTVEDRGLTDSVSEESSIRCVFHSLYPVQDVQDAPVSLDDVYKILREEWVKLNANLPKENKSKSLYQRMTRKTKTDTDDRGDHGQFNKQWTAMVSSFFFKSFGLFKPVLGKIDLPVAKKALYLDQSQDYNHWSWNLHPYLALGIYYSKSAEYLVPAIVYHVEEYPLGKLKVDFKILANSQAMIFQNRSIDTSAVDTEAEVLKIEGPDLIEQAVVAANEEGMGGRTIDPALLSDKTKPLKTSDGKGFYIKYRHEQRQVAVRTGSIIEHAFQERYATAGAVSFTSLGGGQLHNVLRKLIQHFEVNVVRMTYILSDRRFSLGRAQDALELGVGHQMLIVNAQEFVRIAGEVSIQGNVHPDGPVTVAFNFYSGTFTKWILRDWKEGGGVERNRDRTDRNQLETKFYAYWANAFTQLFTTLGATSVEHVQQSIVPFKTPPVRATQEGFCNNQHATWMKHCVCIQDEKSGYFNDWCAHLSDKVTKCDWSLCNPLMTP